MRFLLEASPIMRMNASGAAWPRWQLWHFTSASAIVAALGGFLLLALWSRVSWRQKMFLTSAVLNAVLVLSSDVQYLAMSSYPSHMIEHMLVIFLVAPLVAGAITIPLSRPFATLGFLAFTVLIPLYHLTPLGSWVMSQSGGHYVELGSFLVVGVWFWTPVYGVRRVMGDQQRLTYVVLALPVIATTGLVLWSSTSASLDDTGMRMAMVTIGDIHSGGSVMMVWGSLLMAAHVLGIALHSTLRARAVRQPVGLRYTNY
jgi:cytochrome c oxidase assembly factor CtaG